MTTAARAAACLGEGQDARGPRFDKLPFFVGQFAITALPITSFSVRQLVMTDCERFQAVSEAITAGERIMRRHCTLCGESILYVSAGNGPALYSCGCRKPGASRIVLLSWELFADMLRGMPEG